MTSQKSSLSTFRFTFFSALKGNFIIPFLNLIVIFILAPVMSYFSLKNFNDFNDFIPESIDKEPVASKVTDLYKFLIFDQYNQISFNIFLHISVIVFSILLGVVMFRFIASKKTVNVFYSLGITRNNIFIAKYLAGILLLSVSVVVPFIACLIINISTFGSSPELWSAIIFHIAAYSTLAIMAFSLTAAVFSCVGTIIEGIAFSGIIMLGPTMVFYSIQYLMKTLTFGSPYGHFYDANYQANSLASSLSMFNPILFLFNSVKAIGSLSRESVDLKYEWVSPNYRNTLIWILLSAILFLFGMFLFKKRKAEICGFLGVNKWLNFAVIFFVGFFALSISVLSSSSLLLGIFIGMLIYILLYSIVDFALIRNLKEWAKGLFKLPVHLGAAMLIILVFASGLFGFSSRVPDFNKIESVGINAITYTGIISPFNQNSFGEGDFLYSVNISTQPILYKSMDDLKLITTLHKQIITEGKLETTLPNSGLPFNEQTNTTAIRISYHLRNGETVSRFYDTIKYKNLTSLLALEKTDRFHELLLQNLTEPVTDEDNNEIIYGKEMFQDPRSTISILSGNLDISTQLNLSKEERILLLSALTLDLSKQTKEERFFPESPALGAIQFSSQIAPSYEYEYKPVASGINVKNGLATFGLASIIITLDMQNTINLLKDEGYISDFESINQPISAQIISAEETTDYYYYGNERSPQFMGGWTKILNEFGSFIGSYKINDKTLVDELSSKSQISYFNSVEGYFVRFQLENNGGYTTKYIPADAVPKSIRDAVKNHINTNNQYRY